MLGNMTPTVKSIADQFWEILLTQSNRQKLRFHIFFPLSFFYFQTVQKCPVRPKLRVKQRNNRLHKGTNTVQPIKRTYNKILVRILLPETFDNLNEKRVVIYWTPIKVIMSFCAGQILQQDFLDEVFKLFWLLNFKDYIIFCI